MNTSAPNTILTPAHLSLLIQGFNKDALLLIAGDTGEILASNRKGDELLATHEWQGKTIAEFVENSSAQVQQFLRSWSRSRQSLPFALSFKQIAEDEKKKSVKVFSYNPAKPIYLL
ncbi:hypothetical protein [Beggiatoa leptomitoformis]|uniref:PAS domain-containing protein n=1 Tax=Beggiatoa leptomitoformis TaxID=288004 RepID=A0A2N9YAR3_9GAMM|nr:hypothetical protein [Beggiatoa leptomitoformis]ALG67057.1 hypothetical protein AL038_04165 [Beggiatoa leptomitoformis]AUI67558.1 hypothetical protein BLE401_01845 [Beggiatoa leptomitoformis]